MKSCKSRWQKLGGSGRCAERVIVFFAMRIPLTVPVMMVCGLPVMMGWAQDGVVPPRAIPVEESAEEVDGAVGGEGQAAMDAVGETEEAVPRAVPVEGEEAEEESGEVAPPRAVPVSEDGPERQEAAEEGEEAAKVPAVPTPPPLVRPAAPKITAPDPSKIDIALNTDPNARPVSLRIPAPRGLIVDRYGKPLAQNRVSCYPGVEFPLPDGVADTEVLAVVRPGIDYCRSALGVTWEVTDEEILEHYRKRRWVPMYCNAVITQEKADTAKKKAPAGVVFRPFFLRHYPEKSYAGHLLGQMGKSGGFSTGDLKPEEAMWPPTVGRAGLEKRFDQELTGKPGLYTALYDAKGEKLAEEWRERPRAGHTVVTSIDLEMQASAERGLRSRGIRGAFVIMDVRTGDILAMASTPAPDPNEWVYGIGDEEYKKLINHPDKILYCRATQGLYPPASTFKIVTALAALETPKVDPETQYRCYKGMYFGKIWMWNHSHRDEGSMTVVRAIKRSCNTWFFQAAKACGGDALSSMGSLFGFGDKTGICLEDMEVAGRMPTPEYYVTAKKGSMVGGNLANVSIGQGDVESTPLQVCQMMAGVARGDAVPRPPSIRTALNLSKENLDAVRRGMRAVVADGDGTGTRAAISAVAMAGKTGTGQWQPSKRQYVAWFAGFVPASKPEYAYACLYEGDPGEAEISGGRKVAPIVGEVFRSVYRTLGRRGEERKRDAEASEEESGQGQVTKVRKPRRKTEGSGAVASASRQSTSSPQPAPAPAPAQQRRGGLRGFFDRLRKKE
jgi:penicillin-binding protein 2